MSDMEEEPESERLPYDDRYDVDGEPDFSLSEEEWEERYPELCEW